MSPLVHAAVTGVLLVWVGTLTVLVWRRCRRPWEDDGRPVYQQMSDGRIRFSWHVATALGHAQREHHDLAIERRLSRLEQRLGSDDDTGPIQRHQKPAPASEAPARPGRAER